MPALQRDPHVLEHGQMRKHRRDLERADEPHPRDRRRPRAGDVAPVVEDLAARGRQELREQVEAGRLAGAVRADQRVDRAAPDAQAHVLDRDEALELLGEPPCFENRVVGHAAPARLGAPSPLRPVVADYGRPGTGRQCLQPAGACGAAVPDEAAPISRASRRTPRRRSLAEEGVDALGASGSSRLPAMTSPRKLVRAGQARGRSAGRTPACPAPRSRALFALMVPANARDRGVELGRRDDAVDEPPRQRRRRVDHLAGEQHLHRALAGDVAATPHAGRRAEHADSSRPEARTSRCRPRPRDRTSRRAGSRPPWRCRARARSPAAAARCSDSIIRLQASNSSPLPCDVGGARASPSGRARRRIAAPLRRARRRARLGRRRWHRARTAARRSWRATAG